MNIHDTLSDQDKIVDISSKIGIYLCGVTVYDNSHIGHARTIIIFDVLRRYLESKNTKVDLIQNFTDVDDKIIDRANSEGIPASSISSKYIQDYYDGFDKLNVKRATNYPMATQHIKDMIDLICDLVDKKIAYTTNNGVYFSVSKFTQYGKLSKNIKDLMSGARIKIDKDKHDPLDFALWKFSSTEPSWESPWGRGRPGWHIECSAMSLKYLGTNFDIHGGGRDLIFPHHENEIAQSEAYTGEPFAKIWMHVGMVTINGEKMSKSLGNIKTVQYLLNSWNPNVIRLFCIGGHYSKPIDYSEELLTQHKTNWDRVRLAHYKLIQTEDNIPYTNTTHMDRFLAAMDDNLNTHLALSEMYGLVTHVLSTNISKQMADMVLPVLYGMMGMLGLTIKKIPDKRLEEIKSLILQRNNLRKAERYQDADQIRNTLKSMNIEIKDEVKGTVWMIIND